jgi:hypothetical protein
MDEPVDQLGKGRLPLTAHGQVDLGKLGEKLLSTVTHLRSGNRDHDLGQHCSHPVDDSAQHLLVADLQRHTHKVGLCRDDLIRHLERRVPGRQAKDLEACTVLQIGPCPAVGNQGRQRQRDDVSVGYFDGIGVVDTDQQHLDDGAAICCRDHFLHPFHSSGLRDPETKERRHPQALLERWRLA